MNGVVDHIIISMTNPYNQDTLSRSGMNKAHGNHLNLV